MNTRKREIDIQKGILTIGMILCHCIQFFGKEEYGLQKILVNLINLSTFSGFMFCFGYTNQVAYYEKSWKSSSVKMLRNVFRILIAFYISGIAYVAFVEGKIFRWKFVTEVLLLKKYPGWSEFLASFAAVLLVGIFIYPLMRRMNTIMFVGVACISCMACYIPYDRVHNSWLALLAGSRDYIPFPVLQYAVFFAAGVLFCKKEIRWNVWIFLVVIFAGIPCLRTILETGMLPERFPPSLGFVSGGMALVYGYYLISIGIERKRNLFIIERIAHYLEETGKVSLYWLLLSNLFIFALAGSGFSFRSEGYAYTFFIVILLLMGYLKNINNVKNGGKQK